MSMARELKSLIVFEVAFETITGLLIRAPPSAQVYRIGGADIYPMTTRKSYVISGQRIELDVPYVPGSSVKGRMRSLLELFNGLKLYSTDKKIWQHVRSIEMDLNELIDDITKRCVVDDLFGYAAFNLLQLAKEIAKSHGRRQVAEEDINEAKKYFSQHLAVTRLHFSDFFPSRRYVESKKPASIADFLEEKAENRLDRITAAADPRSAVRVAPGVEFEGTVSMLLFDIDRDVVEKYLNTLTTGFELLELTHLGASGSRGYGRIRFTSIRVSVFKPDKVGERLVNIGEELRKRGVKLEYSNLQEFKSGVPSLAKVLVELLYS